VEKGAFSHTHTDAIAVMCRQWNLPALICKPLEQHHQRPMLTGERSPEDLLWAVSYLAGGVRFSAELAVDPEEDEIRQFAVEALGLQAAALARIRQDAADEYRAISAVFREVLPEGLDIADLLNEANRQLTTAALAAGQRVLDVEQAQSQILGERRQLRKALREYRERAALDPLTHVLNRGAIADALLEAARANLDAGTTAGVLFIDVDDFKSLNDRYGQQAGDSVLRAVAMSLSRHDWPNGIVGRFGGEEFIVLLHDVTEEACRQAGVRAVELIRALKSNELPPDARFTCSVGAAWTDDFRRNTPEQTVAFADQLMSRAKQAGKDRSCFSAMPSAEAPPTAGGSATTSSPALPATLAEQPYNAGITAEVLLRLARQLNTSNSGDSVSLRRRQRNNMVAACVCSYFPNESSTIKKCHAATRNISTAGIGLLSPFPFVRGEPIEIFLPHAEARMYFAGLVAFCRHILGGVYEVGVQLVSHGRAPTFSADSAAALAKRDWAALALAQKFGKPLQSVLV
jgi:diguanylate cyclase (GGDEF)-like protein